MVVQETAVGSRASFREIGEGGVSHNGPTARVTGLYRPSFVKLSGTHLQSLHCLRADELAIQLFISCKAYHALCDVQLA